MAAALLDASLVSARRSLRQGPGAPLDRHRHQPARAELGAHLVRWAAILVGAVGGLSIYAYWLITHHPETVAQLTPLLWQGALYLRLAVLVWRRSTIALTIATVLFLADSGIYTYAIVRLFTQLWQLSQNFVDLSQNYPSLASSNPYDLQHWPGVWSCRS